MAKPFIKWLGGKTQILDKIFETFPNEIDNYHEIFLGGGSVLIELLQSESFTINGKIYAYDINEVLINTYKLIQNNHEELYTYLQVLINTYKQCKGTIINRNPINETEAKQSKENYYYWIRKKFNSLQNKNSIECSAYFIFLNKTCFRGMYRLGPNGFNVPYGHYKSPEIVNKENLDILNTLFQKVTFICCNFEVSLKNVKNNDFVYLDPPYLPENKSSFVNYTENGFSYEQHISLFNLIKGLNCKFLLSNSNTQLIYEQFKDQSIISFDCKRSINSKKPGSKTKEVLVFNFT
jgi:DNA adenine methylase